MKTPTLVASGAAAAALFIAGGVAGDQLTPFSSSSTSETTTVAISPAACTLVNALGQVADPCTVELLKWQQEFRNGLETASYYGKWKTGNPGEYARLRTWGTADSNAPQPAVGTGFGAVVRYGLGQCRTWAVDLASCVLP